VGLGGTSAAVDSDFSSKRSFASTNVTHISTLGNWKLTGSLVTSVEARRGRLYGKRGNRHRGSRIEADIQAMESAGEVAYGRGNSETFFGARYEDNRNYRRSSSLWASSRPTIHQRSAERRVALFRQGLTRASRSAPRRAGAGQGTRFLDGASRDI